MKIRIAILSVCLGGAMPVFSQLPLYKQSQAPIESRISDLLQRMTLEEKIGQLCCPMGWEMYQKDKNKIIPSQQFKDIMTTPRGGFWAVLRADPWTRKTLQNGLNPELAAKALNELQRYATEQTRLGIPLLFAEECPHGHMAIGTTVFPTSLLQASTWDKHLLKRMGEAIALEARLQGANIGYGPVLDVAREPRWSRMEETYGEDPWLTAVLGTSVMKGMQGETQSDGKHLYTTLKHFAAYGIPEAGYNGAAAQVGPRQLFADYLYPFRKAVEAGATTVMTSYNCIDGIPCTANKYLLTDVLRKQWGFNGFVYSDLTSIEGITGAHIAANYTEASALALRAGVDTDLGGNAYGKHLLNALNEKQITIAQIDTAVSRILRLKFQMNLFENPYVSPKEAAKRVRSAEHKALARQVAREGIVLLKNDGTLPLSKDIRSIAVIGPNADMVYNQLGDYTAPQDRKEIFSMLDGIRACVSPQTKVSYIRGCAIRDTTQSQIAEAVELAKQADAVILVLGGSSARDFQTEYIETGAATPQANKNTTVADMECGEGFDRKSLQLLGHQELLLNAVTRTGKPVIVTYIQGRPLNMNLAAAKANALLTAWYPGEQGGMALADILFGRYSPSGKLPVSIPRSEGQLPLYYAQGKRRNYVEGEGSALYEFGYGLSYTQFEYKDLVLEPGENGTYQTIRCTITNTGKYDAAEVVQLYLRDRIASVSLPPILLKGFERIELNKGESKTVTFRLGKEELSFYDKNLNYIVEPGTFDVMIGASSSDIRLQGSFTLKAEQIADRGR